MGKKLLTIIATVAAATAITSCANIDETPRHVEHTKDLIHWLEVAGHECSIKKDVVHGQMQCKTTTADILIDPADDPIRTGNERQQVAGGVIPAMVAGENWIAYCYGSAQPCKDLAHATDTIVWH